MAKKEYAIYPGRSSECNVSAANYMVSVESMYKALDIKLMRYRTGPAVVLHSRTRSTSTRLMAVAYGASAKKAGLDGNIVRATRLEEIAAKKLFI